MSTRSFIGVLAAVLLLGPGIADAVLTSPTDVPHYSGGILAGLGPDRAIDGNVNTFTILLDDESGLPPTTGHMVFDMGSAAGPIVGMELATRTTLEGPPAVGPSDVSFFYYADDDPSNNALVDDIEGDADIVLITTHTFPDVWEPTVVPVAWAGGPNVRYIGMRIDNAWQAVNASDPKNNYQIGEVVFDVIPEPVTLALLSLGGLVSLIRRRK